MESAIISSGRAHDPLCSVQVAYLCLPIEVVFDIQFRHGRIQPFVNVAAHLAECDVRDVQHGVFHLAPHLLDRVQIRAARWQKLQLQANQLFEFLLRPDPQLKIEPFSSNPYRDVF